MVSGCTLGPGQPGSSWFGGGCAVPSISLELFAAWPAFGGY